MMPFFQANPLFMIAPAIGMVGCMAFMVLRRGSFPMIHRNRRDVGTSRNLEQKVYELASRQDGVLTTSDLVLHLGMKTKNARKLLEKLTVEDGTNVSMEVRDDGVLVYEFLDLKTRRS